MTSRRVAGGIARLAEQLVTRDNLVPMTPHSVAVEAPAVQNHGVILLAYVHDGDLREISTDVDRLLNNAGVSWLVARKARL